MKWRWLAGWMICLCLMGQVQGVGLEVDVPSAILIERSTGEILFEQNADTPMAPASVTKVMTLLLVMEALDSGQLSWDGTITASTEATAKGGSQIYLKEGETMSVDDMLKSVVVSSANDCATALAEAVAGSEALFVEKMNQRAQELGMTNTYFVNCTGLDDDPDAAQHLTTARDIATMSQALLNHDEIRNYTSIWTDTVRNGEFGLSNTNKLIRFYDGATGLKTGYTSTAGYCLSASAMRDDMELIAVVLNCPSSTERYETVKSMLNYGFANYALVEPAPEEPIPSVPVTLGQADAITPTPATANGILVDKAKQTNVTTEITLLPQVEAPVAQGEVLGTMTLRSGDEILTTIDLVAPEAVERLTLWQLFGQMWQTICMAEG